MAKSNSINNLMGYSKHCDYTADTAQCSPWSAVFAVLLLSLIPCISSAQLKWENVDSLYQPLPSSVHVYKTTSQLDGKPNIAYYIIADLKDNHLDFTVDTSRNRRLTPKQFYQKNQNPLVVVNTTFFSFETNRSLNLVVKDGKKVEDNTRKTKGKGADSINYYIAYLSAIGISKKRTADIAWVKADTSSPTILVSQKPVLYNSTLSRKSFDKWKVETAVGGGPVLLQNGEIMITNDEELRFAGKAINDKHPRTAMGYTYDNKIIILVIQGRFPGTAEGASLVEEARIFKDLGCKEALNLDGGGSSCLLVNGKETIRISDAAGQRPIPAVFLIKSR